MENETVRNGYAHYLDELVCPLERKMDACQDTGDVELSSRIEASLDLIEHWMAQGATELITPGMPERDQDGCVWVVDKILDETAAPLMPNPAKQGRPVQPVSSARIATPA